MNYDFEVRSLSNKFYINYKRDKYPEIMRKSARAYSCLLIETSYDYYICIPYRSNIKHDNAFHFKNTNRSALHKSGVDYSKTIIVAKDSYIGQVAVVDQDEYVQTITNIGQITEEINKYIADYIDYICYNEKHISKRMFKKKYANSTLKYFHKELKIE